MTVADERKAQRDAEALESRRQAIRNELICYRRSLRWVYVVIALLVLAVILAAVLR